MTAVALRAVDVPAMSDSTIEATRQIQERLKSFPQRFPTTLHALHGGMYSRTMVLHAGEMLVGSLIKVPTMLIVNGHVVMNLGDQAHEIEGYHVLTCSAGRRQVIRAHRDTALTMVLATQAKTVEEAEEFFTTEASGMASRHPMAINLETITGE